MRWKTPPPINGGSTSAFIPGAGPFFLEIADSGSGIPEDIRDCIYDPFFSTKAPEKGTGLGMAIVESILHQHQATIEFECEETIGTTFIICFDALLPEEKP